MTKYLYIILFFANTITAQKGLIRYGYIDAIGIGDAKGPDSNAYLVFNKEQSYYVTAKDSLENEVAKNEQRVYANEDGKGGTISMGTKVSSSGDQVVYHIKKNTMWSNLLFGNQIYVKEKAPKQDWKISKDTKKIGKFNCKKATTTFRGRNYTAWFTSDIAMPFGPWKLHGLPGLILEAYDTDKNVYWYFKGAEYPSKTKETVSYMSIPTKSKWLTFKEFQKVQQDEVELLDDKNKIATKKFPGVQFNTPELKGMFIECE